MGTEERHRGLSLPLHSDSHRRGGRRHSVQSSTGSLPSPIAQIHSHRSAGNFVHADAEHAVPKVRSFPLSGEGVPKKDQTWIKMMYESQRYTNCYKEGLYPLALFLQHLATPVDVDGACIKAAKAWPRLSLWLPDTIVWDEGSFPTWYYTDEHGQLVKTSRFSFKDVQRRFRQHVDHDKPIAIVKFPLERVRNVCKPTSATRLQVMLPKLSGQGVCIQRFVEYRTRSCLLRCRWKRHAIAMDIHYIIGNHVAKPISNDESCLVSVSEYVTEMMQGSANPTHQLDLHSVGGPLRCELSAVMDYIVSYLATFRNLLFEELVCDFTRDKANKLWFLQVKAFIPWHGQPSGMDVGPGVWAGEPQESGDRARCGFCECSFQRNDLQYTLNARQLHAMHDRLRQWNKPLSWSAAGSVLLPRDATSYQCFPVCADCRELHSALEAVVSAGAMLGGLLGDESASAVIPIDAEDTSIYPELFAKREANAQANTLRTALVLNEEKKTEKKLMRSEMSPQFFQNKREQLEAAHLAKRTPPRMPDGWQLDLPHNTTQMIMSITPPTELLRFRILLLIQATGLNLQRLQDQLHEHGMLALTWSVFGMERCVALPRDDALPTVDVLFNAIGTQHFYARCWEDVLKWAESSPDITMFIVAVESGQRLGCMILDLHHVIRRKIELHYFELPVRGCLATSFTATVGFTAGVVSSLGNADLQAHMGDMIYTPPPGVVIPEALPKSWQSLITSQSDCLQVSNV